ncbi:4Fe-4S binding protein [Aneurinibacillus tyrosinisolvens]|uniref:4Fe-4S binding protein n=1 Tax=Aneurinibacillus tyrosinisolvens TaxID=1443435 RepID=UPI000AC81C31|nr:4Fe-4S binding protein [Aneurinibacillus tyrosinisolvens]
MKKRTITQISILLLFFIVPLLDIFRIDLVDLHFYVLRQRFSFSDGLILLLTVLLLVFAFVSIAQWFGRQFCGWMCPHNTFSGYLTKITHSKRLKRKQIALHRPRCRSIHHVCSAYWIQHDRLLL